MNIFTNDDIDFSKDFYTYLSDSYNKHTQEKKLKEHNNKIIKENISKLEDCIKKPFDKTFICDNFIHSSGYAYIYDHDGNTSEIKNLT